MRPNVKSQLFAVKKAQNKLLNHQMYRQVNSKYMSTDQEIKKKAAWWCTEKKKHTWEWQECNIISTHFTCSWLCSVQQPASDWWQPINPSSAVGSAEMHFLSCVQLLFALKKKFDGSHMSDEWWCQNIMSCVFIKSSCFSSEIQGNWPKNVSLQSYWTSETKQNYTVNNKEQTNKYPQIQMFHITTISHTWSVSHNFVKNVSQPLQGLWWTETLPPTQKNHEKNNLFLN